MKEDNIIKKCSDCKNEFQVITDDLLPIEGYIDSDQYGNHLEFVCKCPYCGEVNELNTDEKNALSLDTMKKLLIKYAHCSNHFKRIWSIEKEIEELTLKIANLTYEKRELRNKINLAMHIMGKDHLYSHWPLTTEIIKNEEAKRKNFKLHKLTK